jgi:hypothetical protein
VSDLDDLRAKVALMRELGIDEADGIKLGAQPQPARPEKTKEEWNAEQVRIAQKQHDIMFAASGTKPVLRMVKR